MCNLINCNNYKSVFDRLQMDYLHVEKNLFTKHMLVCTDHTRRFFRNCSQLVTNTYISSRPISDSGSVWFFVNRHFQMARVNACKAHVQRPHAPIYSLEWNPILSLSFSFGFPFLPLSIPLPLSSSLSGLLYLFILYDRYFIIRDSLCELQIIRNILLLFLIMTLDPFVRDLFSQ